MTLKRILSAVLAVAMVLMSTVIFAEAAVSSNYVVRFDANGGTMIEAVTVAKNKTVDEPAAPTRDGYTFDGWYTDLDLTVAYDFSAKVTKSFTLYAKWTAVDVVDEIAGGDVVVPGAFSDVDDAEWYMDGINFVTKNGIMNGVGDGRFDPYYATSRAMLVTILYRLEGEPTVNGLNDFADVEDGKWYTDAVIWAGENEIVGGYGDGNFGTNDDVTREQLAAILYRYAVMKGYDVSVGEDTNILSYIDAELISEYAVPAIQWAVGAGLINGVSEREISPLDHAQRAQIATILMRFCESYVK